MISISSLQRLAYEQAEGLEPLVLPVAGASDERKLFVEEVDFFQTSYLGC